MVRRVRAKWTSERSVGPGDRVPPVRSVRPGGAYHRGPARVPDPARPRQAPRGKRPVGGNGRFTKALGDLPGGRFPLSVTQASDSMFPPVEVPIVLEPDSPR